MSSAVQPPLAVPPEEQGIVAASLAEFGQRIPVVSLHFMPVKEVRMYRTKVNENYRHEYFIPAVPTRDSHPEILYVLDAHQMEFRGSDRLPKYSPETIRAIHIAEDIVHAATGAKSLGPDDIRPAVWITKVQKLPRNWDLWANQDAFRKEYPEFHAEIQAYKKREWAWCEQKMKDGDTWHSKSMPHEINEVHRACARYIGANAAEHPWMEVTSFGAIAPCPFCGAGTSTQHPVCRNCQRVINPAMLHALEQQMKASVPAAAK